MMNHIFRKFASWVVSRILAMWSTTNAFLLQMVVCVTTRNECKCLAALQLKCWKLLSRHAAAGRVLWVYLTKQRFASWRLSEVKVPPRKFWGSPSLWGPRDSLFEMSLELTCSGFLPSLQGLFVLWIGGLESCYFLTKGRIHSWEVRQQFQNPQTPNAPCDEAKPLGELFLVFLVGALINPRFLRTCIVPVAMPSELSRRFPEFLPTWRHRSVSIPCWIQKTSWQRRDGNKTLNLTNLTKFFDREFWALVGILGMCNFSTPLWWLFLHRCRNCI